MTFEEWSGVKVWFCLFVFVCFFSFRGEQERDFAS